MKFWRVIDLGVAKATPAMGFANIIWGYQPASLWPTFFYLGIVLFNKASKESNY